MVSAGVFDVVRVRVAQLEYTAGPLSCLHHASSIHPVKI